MAQATPDCRALKRARDVLDDPPLVGSKDTQENPDWQFSRRRIQRRGPKTISGGSAMLKQKKEREDDLRLICSMNEEEHFSHVLPSPTRDRASPLVNLGLAEVPRRGYLSLEAAFSGGDAASRSQSAHQESYLSFLSLQSPASSISHLDRIGLVYEREGASCTSQRLQNHGEAEKRMVDSWQVARLKLTAHKLADELATTRSQLVAAVRLALGLSQQLDYQQYLLHHAEFPQQPLGPTAAAVPPSAEVADSCDALSHVEAHPEGRPADGASRQKRRRVSESDEDDAVSGGSRGWSGDSEDMLLLMESEDKMCWSCHEGDADVVTLPCRHLVLCKACAKCAVESPKCLACLQGVFHLAD